jgi:hypothetical protein
MLFQKKVITKNKMRDRIVFVLLIAAFVLLLVFTDFGKNRTVVYDCRDAHWHPDIPVEVKKECAKLFYEEWKRKKEQEKLERYT